ncbi:MAG TPA: hypothetical protein VFU02_04545 [Polyangiaceae bacterium]|nr:hypothetical protein [Polyangiaceae bacterium]
MTESSKQVGDPAGGFSVQSDVASAEVQVKAWGFWSVEVASSFQTLVLEACTPLTFKRLVLDFRALKPMRDEGQQGVSALMAALPKLGIERATLITSSQLTKLQLLRIVRETAAKDRVDFVERAEDG